MRAEVLSAVITLLGDHADPHEVLVRHVHRRRAAPRSTWFEDGLVPLIAAHPQGTLAILVLLVAALTLFALATGLIEFSPREALREAVSAARIR